MIAKATRLADTIWPVLVTLIILTAMLAAMVWQRASLLQNGVELVLKTRPVDPRDLLRGHYVRLNYDIGRITLASVARSDEPGQRYKQHDEIYVGLLPDADGFWAPVSLHHTMPSRQKWHRSGPAPIYIRGRVDYNTCPDKRHHSLSCKLFLRYGIEKFFVDKKRAKKLEDFSRQSAPELDKIARKITLLQKETARTIKRLETENRGLDRNEYFAALKKHPALERLHKKQRELIKQQRKLQQKHNQQMAKRFAVIVRIDKDNGEAAISGLQLDGVKIYEEPLF